jgi:arabinan endo-1,5-alpha-L-arabinosidase
MNQQLPVSNMNLHSPAGAKYSFAIDIKMSSIDESIEWNIATNENGEVDSREYIQEQRNHRAYLDFFEKIAADFLLRLPKNRQPVYTPSQAIKYQVILTKNLHPGMIYGYGDPAVLRVNESGIDAYYLVATSNDAPNSFPIVRSENLTDWTFVDYVFPVGKKPSWAADGEGVSDYWAPEMHKVGNEYRLYFVARDRHTHELCIGLARSAKPAGPYVADEAPILKNNVIDPHIYVQDNETAFLYWKEDNNEVWPTLLLELLTVYPSLISHLFTSKVDERTVTFMLTIWPWAKQLQPMEKFQAIQVFIEAVIENYTAFINRLQSVAASILPDAKQQIAKLIKFMKTPMFAQQLSADGSSLVGSKTWIIENDLEWEAHLVEGMWLTKQGDKYYLFYAGNDFSTEQYGIGVAVADSPLGPFAKMQAPLLQSTAEWIAPGHPSVANGPGGTPLLFLHAHEPGKAGYKQFRALLAVPLSFNDNTVTIIQ